MKIFPFDPLIDLRSSVDFETKNSIFGSQLLTNVYKSQIKSKKSAYEPELGGVLAGL
jgi:hypothetical protein